MFPGLRYAVLSAIAKVRGVVPGPTIVRGPAGRLAKVQHFNWRANSERGKGRPGWTYRGARRNALKNAKAAGVA